MVSKKIVLVVLISILMLVTSGCGGVKSEKFTRDNTQTILDSVKNSKDLTGEEYALFASALVRYKLSNGVLEGKTVGEVIEEQRRLKLEAEAKEAEQRRLAEEARQKEEAVALELSKYVIVSPSSKEFIPKNIYQGEYEDYVAITFVFQNKSDKDIRAFRGVTIFNDLFGEKIYSTKLSYDEGIKAGETKSWKGTIKYNQFIDEHKKLSNTELKNIKFEWKPQNIIFVDGTTIGSEK